MAIAACYHCGHVWLHGFPPLTTYNRENSPVQWPCDHNKTGFTTYWSYNMPHMSASMSFYHILWNLCIYVLHGISKILSFFFFTTLYLYQHILYFLITSCCQRKHQNSYGIFTHGRFVWDILGLQFIWKGLAEFHAHAAATTPFRCTELSF